MIPFLDLRAQYQQIGPELERATLEVLRGTDYVLGAPVADFEDAFAAYCGARESVALNTGTSALHLALLAAGVGPGDEVVTVPMTFVATVAAILYAGATPVFVDIDPKTWTMDPSALEAALTPKTKAIVPVHLHGRLADMDAILAVARRHGAWVIEDAAQAHGARRNGISAGTFGDIGCFSFYPGKNLGAVGEGGAIVTNRADMAETIRCLRDWGQNGKYNHVRHGFNYRMDAIQGAALGVKLRHLDDWTDGRRRVAALYDEALSGLDSVQLPPPAKGEDHAYHVYAIRTPDRDGIRARLAQVGVSTGIHYPRPVHLQPAYAKLGYGPGQFPVSEAMAAETLSLPIYPELADGTVRQIARAVVQVCQPQRASVA